MVKGIHALYTMKYKTYLKMFFCTILCKCYLKIKHRNQYSIQATFTSVEESTVGGGGGHKINKETKKVANKQKVFASQPKLVFNN